ncbi:hypothetical protein CH352_03795 [Leptospira hartskeerlii]|uniref:Uncharacterized protein n=2 Tax=Leptospira hartskeerlii TaxID=2023177 RepID=A0A2M9XGH7_9LEPT|nr:hypothetical protein CH357_04660 [Leptospira hartskeerlii]PJZ34732.1 hypothetical protein CH352_03795 [Leptospira hartskeerlii]
MRKICFILLLLFAISPNLISAKAHFETKQSNLLGIYWGPENRTFGWYLEFREDFTFFENYDGDGCGGYSGTYKIESNKIIMQASEEEPCKPYNFQANRTCSIVPTKYSFRYSAKLYCSNDASYFGGFLLPESTDRKIEGVSVKTIPGKSKYLSKSSPARIGPGYEFPSIICNTSEDEKRIQTDRFPERSKLVLLAKAQGAKDPKGKSETWYYADIPLDWGGGCYYKGKSYTSAWFPESVLFDLSDSRIERYD